MLQKSLLVLCIVTCISGPTERSTLKPPHGCTDSGESRKCFIPKDESCDNVIPPKGSGIGLIFIDGAGNCTINEEVCADLTLYEAKNAYINIDSSSCENPSFALVADKTEFVLIHAKHNKMNLTGCVVETLTIDSEFNSEVNISDSNIKMINNTHPVKPLKSVNIQNSIVGTFENVNLNHESKLFVNKSLIDVLKVFRLESKNSSMALIESTVKILEISDENISPSKDCASKAEQIWMFEKIIILLLAFCFVLLGFLIGLCCYFKHKQSKPNEQEIDPQKVEMLPADSSLPMNH